MPFSDIQMPPQMALIAITNAQARPHFWVVAFAPMATVSKFWRCVACCSAMRIIRSAAPEVFGRTWLVPQAAAMVRKNVRLGWRPVLSPLLHVFPLDSREETHLLVSPAEFIVPGNAVRRQRTLKLLHSNKNILANYHPIRQNGLKICLIVRRARIVLIIDPIQIKHTSSARNKSGVRKEEIRASFIHDSVLGRRMLTHTEDGWQ